MASRFSAASICPLQGQSLWSIAPSGFTRRYFICALQAPETDLVTIARNYAQRRFLDLIGHSAQNNPIVPPPLSDIQHFGSHLTELHTGKTRQLLARIVMIDV